MDKEQLWKYAKIIQDWVELEILSEMSKDNEYAKRIHKRKLTEATKRLDEYELLYMNK